MENEKGDWFGTFTGKQMYVLKPEPKDILIEDIAHTLSNYCRFGGHSAEFYSIASHSVLVSKLCNPENALLGLLHDATEAYLGDVIRPLKKYLAEYQKIEKLWAYAIGEAFGLGDKLVNLPEDVKKADNIALMTEAKHLVNPRVYKHWTMLEEPSELGVDMRTPFWAEFDFLERYNVLNVSNQ